MRKIKIGLTGLKPESLVTKAQNIVTKMTDNANFASPNPTLAEISTATDELVAAITAASNRDRLAIIERNDKADALKQMMRMLAYYVSAVGDGDGAVLASSGFELQKVREPMPPVSRPVDFVAVRDAHEGAVKLSWKSVTGARSYVIEVTNTDPAMSNTDWTIADVTTKSSKVIDNLTIGTYYWYRVQAVGSSNSSPWSDVSLVMAA